ncbi:MAG: DUF4118 domain-containing protein [Acidobacteria bacterium]|nr:DUF4118 domain-containing protein [Acidobacteriota bacterium]
MSSRRTPTVTLPAELTSAPARYVVALAFVAMASLARATADPFLTHQSPFLLHFVAVGVATWVCGRWGGVIAVAASVLAVDYLFIEPRGALGIGDSAQVSAAALFVIVGLITTWLTGQWRNTERALRTSQQTMRSLINASTESIWLLDREQILLANTTAARRLGRTVADVVGTPWRSYLSDTVAATRARNLEHVFTTGRPVRFEDERDGIHFDHTFYPAFGEDGEVTAVAAFSRDVTERTSMEQELRAQAEQLALANRLKDDFLATLSHELRTPINAILGWSQILSTAEPTPDRLRKGLDTISRNARLQARMVEELLDMSRIVAGGLRLELRRVDVAALVEQALDAIRPAAEARHLTITTEMQPDLAVQGDAVRLQQVLWNLISNAVKFTPAGGSVAVSAQPCDAEVIISVSDSGIGIAPDFLPHVFERFRQADSSPTREHGGLGLGLAIVRHIVELHGGLVAVASDGVGRGTTFTVRLPAAPQRIPI